MEKGRRTAGLTVMIGSLVIASAIIWGLVIVGTSYKLRGTECYHEIQNYLAAGAIMHFFLIGGLVPMLFKKQKDTMNKE